MAVPQAENTRVLLAAIQELQQQLHEQWHLLRELQSRASEPQKQETEHHEVAADADDEWVKV